MSAVRPLRSLRSGFSVQFAEIRMSGTEQVLQQKLVRFFWPIICPIFLSNFFGPIFLSDYLSDYLLDYLSDIFVRFFCRIICPIICSNVFPIFSSDFFVRLFARLFDLCPIFFCMIICPIICPITAVSPRSSPLRAFREEVPPRETSPASRSVEKRMFSKAIPFFVRLFCPIICP